MLEIPSGQVSSLDLSSLATVRLGQAPPWIATSAFYLVSLPQCRTPSHSFLTLHWGEISKRPVQSCTVSSRSLIASWMSELLQEGSPDLLHLEKLTSAALCFSPIALTHCVAFAAYITGFAFVFWAPVTWLAFSKYFWSEWVMVSVSDIFPGPKAQSF